MKSWLYTCRTNKPWLVHYNAKSIYENILGSNEHCEAIKKKILPFEILLADNIHVLSLIENIKVFCINFINWYRPNKFRDLSLKHECQKLPIILLFKNNSM